ncbi:MAG: recombinase RecT [Eubacteriales bacterium]
MKENNIKETLELQAKEKREEVKLNKSMTIADMIKAMAPEIKRALPSVLTPERFTRIALSALNSTPQLKECTPLSFIGALLNAAQLGLEPNTPLGQAYLIPYKNKGVLECQFQIGYKGLIDLAYRNEQIKIIQAQCVYDNDEFYYEYGLDPQLIHKPTIEEKGMLTHFYGIFRMVNGGYGFAVMSKNEMDSYAKTHSKSYETSYSPWKSSYEEMAKKTVIKQALKYAPIKTDFQRALSSDESIKKNISVDMAEVHNEVIDYNEIA